jgi:murein L,D-transpeptidase YafK
MRNILRLIPLFLIILLIGGCAQLPYELQKILNRVQPEMQAKNIYVGDPVFIRVFKEESELELWMKGRDDHHYTLIKTYPICKWSGGLGPKFQEGDHQAPEGFYATDLTQLNPNSMYHLSFNIQFPNDFDRYHGRTGTFLMIHGDCISEGCYAMTDPLMEEIYVLVERALLAGQQEVPVHAFPFRMTEKRMMHAVSSPHYQFWRNIKEGYDYFERFRVPPLWTVANGRYEFY